MATEKSAKNGLWTRFMHKYESYQGKTIVNIIYSAGASVVIIGALFKILHWPGASQVLMVGMFTEAFLFLIGTLERPHPEFHWENVFPQLLEYGTKPELLEEKATQPRPSLLGAGVMGEETPVLTGSGVTGSETRQPAAKVPSLKDEDLEALKAGIADLAKTAAQLSELGKVAQTGVKLGEKLAAAEVATEAYSSKMTTAADTYVAKLAAAGEATANYTAAAGKATTAYTEATATLADSYAQVSGDMKQVAEETRAYKAGVERVGQQLASLNSVYELQLQAVNAQIEAQKAAAAAAKEAAEAQSDFAKGTKQLQKQVADLNSIYGNMLNALS
ncbi:MAG: gliding motility protein GldL [Paludibacteraceae bacterium]|nr:gliding motility protein GldL [Paludibacteraceae bacterium]